MNITDFDLLVKDVDIDRMIYYSNILLKRQACNVLSFFTCVEEQFRFFFESGGKGRGRMGRKISPKRKTFESSIKARH